MTTDLEPVTGEIERTAPLLPMSVAQADGAMRAYQELCAAVLVGDDWIGTPGAPESFVKRSGWQKLSTFYGVSTELVGDTTLERDTDGKLMRAAAKARAIARDGRHADGGGACGRNEPRFANARGRQKIEHDLPATAETRATNRAISNLIGFGAVSAEEVDADVRAGAPTPDLPPWAADIPDAAVERLEANLVAILDELGAPEPETAAGKLASSVMNYADGVFPAVGARLAHLLAQAIPQTAPDEPVEPELEADEAAAAPDIPPEGASTE